MPANLMAKARPIELAFFRSGYEVQTPLFFEATTESAKCVHMTFQSHLGAGDLQDVHIELTEDDVCKVFTGPSYSILPTRKPSEAPKRLSWKRAEISWNTPDIVQLLVRKAREMLLEE